MNLSYCHIVSYMESLLSPTRYPPHKSSQFPTKTNQSWQALFLIMPRILLCFFLFLKLFSIHLHKIFESYFVCLHSRHQNIFSCRPIHDSHLLLFLLPFHFFYTFLCLFFYIFMLKRTSWLSVLTQLYRSATYISCLKNGIQLKNENHLLGRIKNISISFYRFFLLRSFSW